MDDIIECSLFSLAGLTAMALLFCGIVAAVSYGVSRPSCYAQWRDSGMQVRWSLFGDCQLKVDGSRWIIADAYTRMQKNVQVK